MTFVPQDVRSMLSLDETPTTSPDTPFYKRPGDFKLKALEEALLTFRSQGDRSESETLIFSLFIHNLKS